MVHYRLWLSTEEIYHPKLGISVALVLKEELGNVLSLRLSGRTWQNNKYFYRILNLFRFLAENEKS